MALSALRMETEVLPGGRIEITEPTLPVGELIEVIVLRHRARARERRSVMEILADAPGQRQFKTARDVETYLQDEHSAWDR